MGRLSEIKQRVEKATKGPWETETANPVTFVNSPGGKIAYATVDRMVNAQFIAHSREDVPWLILEVERLELKFNRLMETYDRQITLKEKYYSEVERLRGVLDEIESKLMPYCSCEPESSEDISDHVILMVREALEER